MALIPITEVAALVADALRASGASESMARVAAKCLVAADAKGLATHGVMRVPSYCGHLKSGRANGAAAPRIVNEKPAACLIDAGNGLGFEPCDFAIRQAIERESQHGIGFAGVTKGTMLALAVELLCCALTGAALSHEVASMHTSDGPPLQLGQAFLVIDPAALAGSDVYFERIETLVAAMLEDDGVRLPGDRRHALAARAAQDGIEISADLEKQLRELAQP